MKQETGNALMSHYFRGSAQPRRRRGNVTLLTAGGLMMIMGCAAMAVDYGLLVADANRLQRACDAAALAGAMKLKQTYVVATNSFNDTTDTTNARSEAILVAARNGVTVTSSNVTFLNNNSQIRVSASATRNFFFARVIGQTSGSLTRMATAQVAAGNNLSTAQNRIRVAPIGVTWETYNAYWQDQVNYHDIELIRQNKQTFGLNDLVLFDLRNTNAKSGPHMKDQLTGDEIEYSAIGDYETTLNAAQPAEQKHFSDGLDTLFAESAAAPWNDSASGAGVRYSQILAGTSPRDNPRVVYLIVTPSTSNPNNGTFDTQVQGYVPVYIENYAQTQVGTGKNKETVMTVRFRFLPPGFASDGTVKPNPGGNLAGVRVVSLVG